MGHRCTDKDCNTTRKTRKRDNRRSVNHVVKTLAYFCAGMALFATALFAGCGSAVLQEPSRIDLTVSVKPLLAEQGNEVWLLSGKNSRKLGNVDSLSTERGNPDSLSVMVSESGWVYYVSPHNLDKGTGDLLMTHGDSEALPVRVSGDVSAACVSRDGQALFCKNVGDGARELWLCAPGGKTKMIAQGVVPDMFSFSDDGSQFHYVRNTGSAYGLYLASGSDSRMIYQAEPPEFRYFTAIFDGKGGLLFGLGRTLDEMCMFSDKDGKLTESGGQPVAVFGTTDDFLYYRMEGDSPYEGQPPYRLDYKAPDKGVECVSENCSGVAFPGKSSWFFDIGSSKSFLLAESSGDVETLDIPLNSINGENMYFESSGDAATEELYLYTIGGEKTYIGQASLYSNLLLSDSLNSVVVIQDDGLYLYHCEDGEWTGPESLGTCYQFEWNGRYLYWLDTGNVLRQCDLDSGSTKQLLDKAMGLWLIDDELYVCVDNERVGRLTKSGVQTLIKEGGDVTAAAGGVYVSTFYGDIVWCAKDGTEQKRMLSEAEIMRGRGRLRFGYLTEQAKAALTVLQKDASYYLGVTDADGGAPTAPYGTPEEDAMLALSLWRGTMPDDAFRAAGLFYDMFSRLAEKKGNLSEDANEELFDLLNMASSLLDMSDEGLHK